MEFSRTSCISAILLTLCISLATCSPYNPTANSLPELAVFDLTSGTQALLSAPILNALVIASTTSTSITLAQPTFATNGNPSPTVQAYIGLNGTISATGSAVTGSIQGPVDVSSAGCQFSSLSVSTSYVIVVVAQNTLGYSVQQITQSSAGLPSMSVIQGATIANNGSYTFGGSQLRGNSSGAITFTIQNSGTGPLTLGTITVSGTNSSDFSVTQPSLTTVAAAGGTTFTITFVPGGVGARAGAISIPSDDPSNSTYIINLTGQCSGRIFVTASAFTGNMGGISGADGLCMADAQATALGGTFKAMIVDSTPPGSITRQACTTFNCTNPAENINWVLRANTTYLQIDGITTIMTTNSAGIFPFGTLTNPISSTGFQVWSGLNFGWNSGGNTCGPAIFPSWRTTNPAGNQASAGVSNSTDFHSINDFSLYFCTNSFHLYCVEQ